MLQKFGRFRNNAYICSAILDKIKIMAISIKTIPVLMGETADRFIQEADVNSANNRPILSETMERAISDMLEASRTFRFR